MMTEVSLVTGENVLELLQETLKGEHGALALCINPDHRRQIEYDPVIGSWIDFTPEGPAKILGVEIWWSGWVPPGSIALRSGRV